MKTIFFTNCMGVFQGGGCKGVAYVGAFRKSVELGIYYSELVGTSAGSIVATLIGAGATPDQLEKMMRELDFQSMKATPDQIISNKKSSIPVLLLGKLPFKLAKQMSTIACQLGLFSSYKIEEWVSQCLSEITGIKNRLVKFDDLRIPTSVVATDLSISDRVIWSTHATPDFSVAKAVRASCSIPFFYQPVDFRYVDGGLLSNLPSFVFKSKKESHYGRVLAYCLVPNSFSDRPIDIKSYINSLAGAVVDGSQSLQIGLQDNIYCVKIQKWPRKFAQAFRWKLC